MKAWRWSAMLLTGTLTACSFAPAYKIPDSAPATSAYKESGDLEAAQPVGDQHRAGGWRMFQGPQLEAVETQIGDANQDWKAGCARLQQARAASRTARADPFPTLSAGS